MNDNKLTNLGLFVLRLVVGIIFLYYGSQKLLGLFGGLGFNSQLSTFQNKLGIPPAFGSLAIFAEFFGGLGILVGLLTRVAAFGLASTMMVASVLKIQAFQTQVRPEMQELFFPLSLLGSALALMLIGAGRISLDYKFFGKKRGITS